MMNRSMPRRDRGAPRTRQPDTHPTTNARPAFATRPDSGTRPNAATPAAPPTNERPTPTVPVAEMQSFAELALSPGGRAAVDAMGITTPTPIQASAIPPLL